MAPETVADVLDALLPGLSTSRKMPRWPADVFCLSAALLHRSGAYTRVVEDAPPHLKQTTSQERSELLRGIGLRWRTSALTSEKLPTEVLHWWGVLNRCLNRPVSRVRSSNDCCEALLNLMGCADESFFGVGIFWPIPGRGSSKRDRFLEEAEEQLISTWHQGSTLCRTIHPSRARVLPKMHTPQNGLTIRSLSHHLAYCRGGDVIPHWLSLGADTQHHALNLLLVPWPYRVSPSQFKESKRVNLTDEIGKGGYGLFTFSSERGPTTRHIKRLIDVAHKNIGRIDGLIFPELSMSTPEFQKLAKSVMPKSGFLVAGTGTGASRPNKCGQNGLVMNVQFPDSPFVAQLLQKKHHRWKLNKSQIMQYGIGANLHPEASWWEHISLKERELHFVTLRPWLTMSVMICEDLARPDPVADLVRSVGPNLVLCLLMDGPQLAERWPGRYAGVLSDDPGSSVLTMTSFGMSRLSRPQGKESRSSVVALWRDAVYGTKEIELPSNADAVVLNLSVEYKEEWTADGRGDGGTSGYPVLTGSHPISLGEHSLAR